MCRVQGLSGCLTLHAAGSGEHGWQVTAAGVPAERSTCLCHAWLSGGQPSGPPTHPCARGAREGNGGFYQSLCTAAAGGSQATGTTLKGSGRVSSQYQMVTQNPAWSPGYTPDKENPCETVGVHGRVGAPHPCNAQGHTALHAHVGVHVCVPTARRHLLKCKDRRPWGPCRWQFPLRSTLAPLAVPAGPPESPEQPPTAPRRGSGCWQ